MLFDELDGLHRNTVCNVFVFPQSLLTSFHIADTGNTVHDCLVMPVVRTRF